MPMAFVVASTHLWARPSRSCKDNRGVPRGRTSAQIPHRFSGSPRLPEWQEKLKMALLPGKSLHLQVSELAGPEPTNFRDLYAEGCLKTSVMLDMESKVLGFSINASSVSSAALLGLRACVWPMSSTQSVRTPASCAGPFFKKSSTRTPWPAKPCASLVKTRTSEPTLRPSPYTATASGSSCSFCVEGLLVKQSVTPVMPSRPSLSRLSSSPRFLNAASNNLFKCGVSFSLLAHGLTPPMPFNNSANTSLFGFCRTVETTSKYQPSCTP
mmetsp:Transcript_92082/g.256554  ORF Transcript_92082/g.256554 Transcript_92082/m.256554 type:complete len:269 (-) Transcript_92082:990-1796(-)